MNNFLISPEICLILKAFRDSNSLREAASLLNCDPAGLTRKVQMISQEYGFLEKVNNRWQVSSRGLDLVAWVEESIQTQHHLISEKSSLRFASTMWFFESQIIPNLMSLKKKLGTDISLSMSVPSKSFDDALIGGSVDFVIVCHPPNSPEIEHRQLINEKWIIVAPSSWKSELKKNFHEIIQDKPFIRHTDINQDLLIPNIIIRQNDIVIDNLIGVRSAVCSNLGWSIVPKILVRRELEEGRLIELHLEVPIRDRKICVWWLRNRQSSKKIAHKICAWINETC